MLLLGVALGSPDAPTVIEEETKAHHPQMAVGKRGPCHVHSPNEPTTRPADTAAI
jgi:hypothetical protein